MKKWSCLDRWSLRLLGILLLLAGGFVMAFGSILMVSSFDFGIDWVRVLIFGLPTGSIIAIGLACFLFGLRLIFMADAVD